MKSGKFLILFVIFLSVVRVYASDLDSFESSLVGSGSSDRGSSDYDFDFDDDDDDESIGDWLLNDLVNGLLGFSNDDEDEAQRDSSNGWISFDLIDFESDHVPGGFCIPYFRGDVAWQYIKSDMEAIDYRVQVGVDGFAIDFNHTRFNEWDPVDGMDIYRVLGLLRISAEDAFEIDLGLGTYTIDGESSHTGFAATVPIIISPTDELAFEFRPVWTKIHGNDLKDFDLNISLKYGYVGFRGGYRWLETDTISLNGPYVGMTVRF